MSGYNNQTAAISVSSSGDNTIVAAVADHMVVVVGYTAINAVGTAQAITWKSGASTSITGAMALPSAVGGGLVSNSGDNQTVLFATAPGQALVLNLSAATAVGGHVSYRIVRG